MHIIKKTLLSFCGLLVCVWSLAGSAADKLQPMILASESAGSLPTKVAEVKKALQAQGFEVVGEYSPYRSAHLVVVTSDYMQQQAAKSDFGGFGAAERVGITEVDGKVQVAYMNPVYMAAAYRMEGDLKPVADKLAAAIGKEKAFGSKDGLSDSDLRGYHYMFSMPYFDDLDKLKKYDSHRQALEQVEKSLKAGLAGVRQVYRIDIPGRQETVFGVSMTEEFSSDQKIMGIIDTTPLRHTPHLPYELLVSGKKAVALNARFRIAIDFPDLTMGTFMKIYDAPDAIKEVLKRVARGR